MFREALKGCAWRPKRTHKRRFRYCAIPGEITSFVFEDNEEELDVMEVFVSDRHLRFVDHPLFQEGNEIVARFGYVNDLAPGKKAVLKDVDYDFPVDGDPRIRLAVYLKALACNVKRMVRARLDGMLVPPAALATAPTAA